MLRPALFCGLILASSSHAQSVTKADLFEWGPYDRAIQRPDVVLGYEPGSRHTFYMDQQRVVTTLVAEAPTKTRYFEIGKSWEGRPLRIVAISSPENIKNLDNLKARWQRAAQGKPVEPGTPALVWINENIHGDEAASFEAGMFLMYNLIASKNEEITKALQNVVVVVNPSYNPDGHERYTVWQRALAVGSPDPASPEHRSPAWVTGRVNHYRFDMNRDRLAMSQMETRAEVKAFLSWNPQVYADQHGEVGTYFFPPTAMSMNDNVDRARYKKWTEIFGRANAAAFDKKGWGYFIKDTYDFSAPIYLDTFATLSGAIGMTYETDAAEIARMNPDGSVRTLLGGLAKHVTTALATIRATAANSAALLDSFVAYKASAMDASGLGNKRYFAARATDAESAKGFTETLGAMGITYESHYGKLQGAQGDSLWKDKEMPTSTGYWVTIDLCQPQGHFAKTILETESNFEEEFIKEQLRRAEEEPDLGYEFYDLTGWTLPFLHNVDAWWLKSAPSFLDGKVAVGKPGESTVGFAIEPSRAGTALAMKLLQQGVRLKLNPKPMVLSGTKIPAWSILALRRNNDAEKLADLAKEPLATPLATGYPDTERYGTGSDNILDLHPGFKPGVLFGDDQRSTSFGSLWYLLESNKIPFTPLRNDALNSRLDRFTTLVLPQGASGTVSQSVKDFVSEGGCLVILGGRYGATEWLNLKAQSAVPSPKPVPGSIFRAKVDADHWLTAGFGRKSIAVPVDGTQFYAKDENTVIAVDDENSYLTGWVWPNESEKAVSGTSFCEVVSVGNGHVVWFAQDPTERAMWPGLWPLLVNAMVLGPRI